MNQQRLVAAIAALAAGFAVTLVGVGVADDEITADPTQADEVFDESDEDAESGDGGLAEQEEEVAEEPEAAEAEAPLPSATEPSTQQGQPVPTPTSAPVPTNAPESTSPPDGNQAEPGQDRPFPNDGIECATVLRLEYTDRVEFAVLISDLGDDRFLILDANGDDVIDLSVEDGLEEFGIGTRLVEFENGRFVAIAEPCDLDEDGQNGGIGEQVDVEPSTLGEVFPCSDSAFDGIIRPLSDLELTELIEDRDVFLASIAKRLAALGSTSDIDWFFALQDEFDSFAELPDGCSAEIEAAFVGNGLEFFCAAALISSDRDLFVFLQERVGQAMARCTFVDESARGGN